MKGINTSCTSQESTAIISSSMEVISSESSSASASASASSSSSSYTVGGRAIDRYNPIITDERRRGPISNSAPTTPGAADHPVKTPVNRLIMRSVRKKKSKKITIPRNNTSCTSNNIHIIDVEKRSSSNYGGVDDDNQVVTRRKSFSKPSDLIIKAGCTTARPGVDNISPPESSRYLLNDTSFLDVLSDFDRVLNLVPLDSKNGGAIKSDGHASKAPRPASLASSSGPSDQVVVLRVSLHCRGCERKMKKHLSRMAGVKSFNIDFTAKKVTVVGDVTPLSVLASISKVKNAQLWTPAMSSSFPVNSRNMESRK